jgi:hypothetical protein
MTTITGGSTKFVVVGGTLNAFSDYVVADPVLNTVETVTVSLGGSTSGSLSDTLAGNNGTFSGNTFTESGSVTGSPTFATQLLQRLVYTAPTNLALGQSAIIPITVSVADPGSPPTATLTENVDIVTNPAINGTVPKQPVASGGNLHPYATLKITDTNFGNTAQVTATISIKDDATGATSDADDLLTGAGLSETSPGNYTIAAANPFSLSSTLQNLSFTSSSATVDRTVDFTTFITDVKANLTTSETNTSVLIHGTGSVTPAIAGTAANQQVQSGQAISPFSKVSVTDGNTNASDSVTITLTDASGNATDANGKLSGGGLTQLSAGVYTLAAAAPGTITSELNALVFTPTALASGQTSQTTNFKLDVNDAAANQSVPDTTTSVVETVSGGTSGATSGDFVVNDNGATSYTNGDPYTGGVQGIDRQFIDITPDNLLITATVPNVFIHSGSGGDAIDVSHVNGTNVMDGSTGSNFLVGGTGFDTFFTDAAATVPVWTTIANFHAGDVADIWNITSANQLLVQDDRGAAGFTGLTISTLEPNGNNWTTVTLAGYSSADLASGKVTISYGSSGGLNYMSLIGH